jgi:hypothetical protein
MKQAMRDSLRECLGTMKRGLRNKRAMAYEGKEEDEGPEGEGMAHEMAESPEEERAEHEDMSSHGSNKGLSSKVAEAESSAEQEIEDSGDWRKEEMMNFMKKRAKPSVRKEGSFVAVMGKSNGKPKGKKG